MKKAVVFIAGCMLFMMSAYYLSALETTPSGKNLLNPAYFQMNAGENVFYTAPRHPVEPGEYTLTLPTELDGAVLTIESGQQILVEESSSALDVCDGSDSNIMVCHLTLRDGDFYMEVRGGMASQHFGHLGLEGFQLELGDEATPYEPYTPVNEDPPSFSGSGYMVLSYQETPSIESLVDAHIGAYDEIDGDLSDDIDIVEDEYSGNEGVIGDYEVRLEVSDSSGNTAYFTLTIMVKDEIPPVITGPDSLNVDVDAPPALEDLIAEHFEFFDDYDGMLSGFTIHEDNYSHTLETLGEKTVTFGVQDESGNEALKTFTVVLEDVTPPVIDGPDVVDIKLSNPKSFNEILLMYTLSDNHTPETDIAFYVVDENFSDNLEVPGEYSMDLKAVDASGNETHRTVQIHVHDDVPPTLSGPIVHRISYTETFDWRDLRARMYVNDNVDDLTLEHVTVVENTVESGEIGTYSVRFKVADSSGNESTHKVSVEIIDDVPPVFTVDERIVVTEGSTLSQDDMLSIALRSAQAEGFEAVEAKMLYDGYTNNEKVPGTHSYEVELTNRAGDSTVRVFEVLVEGADASTDSALEWFILCGAGLTALFYIGWRRKR